MSGLGSQGWVTLYSVIVKATLLGVCAVGLSACTTGLANISADRSPDKTLTSAGSLLVGAPVGYCIDKDTAKTTRATRFAMFASCSVIRSGHASSRTGVITVSVGTKQSQTNLPQLDGLAKALQPSKIVSSSVKENILILQIAGEEMENLQGADDTHWRGITYVENTMVSVAVYPSKGGPLTTEAGRNVIVEVVETMRALNGDTRQAAFQSQTDQKDQIIRPKPRS